MKKTNFTLILLLFYSTAALSADYLSSVYSGYQLGERKGLAIVTDWSPENKISFDGQGPIKLAGLCLTAVSKNYVTWEACKDTRKSQIWSFNKKRLMNRWGYCIDLENANAAGGTKLITAECSTEASQHFRAHDSEK